MNLLSIDVQENELEKRLRKIHPGMSESEVSAIFGGNEIDRKIEGDKIVCFWRFRLVGVESIGGGYMIYMGEFKSNSLTFGMLTPEG